MAKREIPAKIEIVCDVCAAECVGGQGGNYRQGGVVNVQVDPTYKASGSYVLYLCDNCLIKINNIIHLAKKVGDFNLPPKGKK